MRTPTIRIIRRMGSLSSAQRRLLLEATAALAFAALAIALFPFRRIAAAAGKPVAEVAQGEMHRSQQVALVRWAVTACARRLPWRTKCFEQGLAAQWMLGRRSVSSTLFYGVARSQRGLIAHVWLKAGPLDVVGCENSGDFSEIARFPAST